MSRIAAVFVALGTIRWDLHCVCHAGLCRQCLREIFRALSGRVLRKCERSWDSEKWRHADSEQSLINQTSQQHLLIRFV